MSKILVVLGATGLQGGSIVTNVLNHPTLSKEFKIRTMSRNSSGSAAEALRDKGVEVLQGDVDNDEDLKQVVKDAHTVCVLSLTVYAEDGKEREIAGSKAMADAAVAAGAKQLIYSTLPNSARVTGGKITVFSFDAKAEVEKYIRSLPVKSFFFAPVSYMQNLWLTQLPRPAGDGTYVLSNIVSPETRIPYIDVVNDTGKYVCAMLEKPEKFEGKVLYLGSKAYTYLEIAEILSKKSGKTVRYKQLPSEVWQGFLPPVMGEVLANMFLMIEEFNFFGHDTERLLDESAKEAGVKRNTLEELVEAKGFHLDAPA